MKIGKPSKQFQLYVNGNCVKCGNKREDGNKTFYCKSCGEGIQRTHTEMLSQ